MLSSQSKTHLNAHHSVSRLLPLLLLGGVTLLYTAPAYGHELWLETGASAKPGTTHRFEIFWGHSGERASGRALQSQADKIDAQVVHPDGKCVDVPHAQQEDCFTANTTPNKPGYYLLGATLQTGIISRPLHHIPENTRIIMYGKTLTHVPGSDTGLSSSLGFDLELVPLAPPEDLRRGKVIAAKVLFKGKSLGGGDLEVTLSTAGATPPVEDPRIQSRHWSTSAMPHPQTGEVAFPLITAGRHFFTVRYFDETPGRYQGDHDFQSDFSHLRKGDEYERTMYVSTLTVVVE